MLKLENYDVEIAQKWTDLFKRESGWFGGDGIFSLSKTGIRSKKQPIDTVTFYFSDTFIGEVNDSKPLPGYKMVHNSYALFDGYDESKMVLKFFYKKDNYGHPLSLFEPDPKKNKDDSFFWLGDGFINKENNNNTIYIFAYHVKWTGKNVFDFTEPNVSIIKIEDQPKFLEGKYEVLQTPFHIKKPKLGYVNLGAGIFVNTKWAGAPQPDENIYIYGCLGKDKNLVVARVAASKFESFSKWKYWDGAIWQDDRTKIRPITNRVSNELSVTPMTDGKYLLIFQLDGLSDKVACRVGESPVGPFGEVTELFVTPESKQGLFTYNAKAHPVLSKENRILISYNTISYDFWNDIEQNAHIYRPRFIYLNIY
tara:strand:- start:1684 stop:2784 length:1101 start_codon:yes stop_codon:yes gene_type:complete